MHFINGNPFIASFDDLMKNAKDALKYWIPSN